MKTLTILFLLQIYIPISKYLSYKEAIKSAHAVPSSTVFANIPTGYQLHLIREFGLQSFDPLRLRAKSPLYVSSLFRSYEINKKVGGAVHSEHLVKDNIVACDIDQDGKKGITNKELFFLIKNEVPFRKLIWEFGTSPKKINPLLEQSPTNTLGSPGWVHYSWSIEPEKNIRKVYIAKRVNNVTIYKAWEN